MNDRLNRTLLQFLKTGELGCLKCGLHRDEVRRLLGNPKSWDGRENHARDWRYDALTIYFENHRVVAYGLGFHPSQVLPTCIDGLASPAYLEISMESIRTELTANKIAFEEGKLDQTNLRTEAGVCIFSKPTHQLMNILFVCPEADRFEWLEKDFPKKSAPLLSN